MQGGDSFIIGFPKLERLTGIPLLIRLGNTGWLTA